MRTQFTWNGRTSSGALAPDGEYFVRVHLVHQGRTVTISDNSGPVPFRVITHPPRPLITNVSPHVIHAPAPVRIAYAGNGTRAATVLIYKLAPRRRPRLVKTFLTSGRVRTAIWNGLIKKQPPPPGRYLIGLKVTDAACNTAWFPARLSPLPPGASAYEVAVLP